MFAGANGVRKLEGVQREREKKEDLKSEQLFRPDTAYVTDLMQNVSTRW